MNSPPAPELNCPLCEAKGGQKFSGYRLRSSQGLFPTRNYKEADKVYSCDRCELIYPDAEPVYRKKVFDEDDSLLDLTGTDAEEIKNTSQYTDVLDYLKTKAGLKPGAKVLDIGAGIGRVAFILREEKFETYAVEPKKQLFDYAIKNGFVDKDKFYNVALEDLLFKDEEFDFIFLEPLNHLQNPGIALKKTLALLKPGGHLHLQVINSRWLYKRALNLFYKITFRKHLPYTSLHRKPFNACEYSPRSFKVYAELYALEFCQQNSYPCETFMPGKLLKKGMEYFMWRFNQGMELSLILKKPESLTKH